MSTSSTPHIEEIMSILTTSAFGATAALALTFVGSNLLTRDAPPTQAALQPMAYGCAAAMHAAQPNDPAAVSRHEGVYLCGVPANASWEFAMRAAGR